MGLNMWISKSTFFYASLLILISCFNLCNAGYDYDYDDVKDPWTRCPWIRNKLKNGRVRIRSRGRIAKFSCKSGYELAGKRFATCIRGQWNNPVPFCVARGCPKVTPPTNGHITEMNQGAQLSFDCGPGYTLFGETSLYCDGKEWNAEAPTCQATTLQPNTSCDFEDPDLCGWTHGINHHFDWKRHQFHTPSFRVGTGPSFDHTFGKGKAGYYMYIEASSPRNPNDTARLFSPVYSRHYSPGCFVFWYHMYGVNIGKLRVYFMTSSSILAELPPSWEKQGNQGNKWYRANITIPETTENFQIIIEGIVGESYIGDAAIDDVRLFQSNCSSVEESTNTTETAEESDVSCRGRCHEADNSTSCRCTDACVSDNTCCSDYLTLCATGDTSTNGRDESKDNLTTAVIPEIYTGSFQSSDENVGTEYTVTPEILYTESIVSTEITTPQTKKSSEQYTVKSSEVTSDTVHQTNHEPTIVSSTIQSSSASSPSVSSETSITSVASKQIQVTTQSVLITSMMPVSTDHSTPAKIFSTTNALPTINEQSGGIQTSRTTTSVEGTSEGSVPYIPPVTVSKTTSRAPASSSSALPTSSSRTSSMATSNRLNPITEVITSSFAPQSVSEVEITSNTAASVENSRYPFIPSSTTPQSVSSNLETTTIPTILESTSAIVSSSTTSTAISTLSSTLKVVIPTISRTTPSVTSATARARTIPPVTVRTSGAVTTLPDVLSTVGVITTPPVTSRTGSASKSPTVTSATTPASTTLPAISRTNFVRTTVSITLRTSYVRTTPPSKFITLVFPTTKKYIPTFRETTASTRSSVTTGSTPTATRIEKSTTKPLFYTTQNQQVKYSSEIPDVRASKATSDMQKNHGPNVIGICIGVVLLLVLAGAVAFVYLRRRRQMQSKLNEDSEMRFLPDSEVIEYSDACALDRLVSS